jgi:hypothetical protein
MSIVKPCIRLAAALVVAATALSVGGGSAVHAAGAVPWTDTAVTGAIGLCDRSGHAVESGSVDTTPFVWRAVSTAPAPSPYNKPGRTATLYAFQPQPGLAPGEWSGDMLTSSTRYTNPAHPMAEATGGDLSLAGFIGEFPPRWDGLLQLRMYLAAPNEPAQSLSYAATTIKVSGSTWSVVSGGSGPCTAGNAESIESIVLPSKDTAAHSTATTPPATKQPTGVATKRPAATGSPSAAGGGSGQGTLDASGTSTGSGSSTNPLELVVIALLAAAAGGAAVTWRGRRKKGSTS